MILWTLQHPSVLDRLQKGETYTVADDKIMFPESEYDNANYAYRWLCEQMKQHIGNPPQNVTYPIWAWYKQQGQPDGKPDMRSMKSEEDWPATIRMKLDIPDWKVMLTDFDDWNSALNYWYVPKNKADYEAYSKMLELAHIDWLDVSDFTKTSKTLKKIRRIIEDSWTRIINVNPQEDSFCGFEWNLRTIQATFWELKPEYVISTETFKTRR